MVKRVVLLIMYLVLGNGVGAQENTPIYDLDLIDVTYEIDDQSNAITVNFQIDYFSTASDIVWVIPVPSPILEVSNFQLFTSSDLIEPDLPILTYLPINYCGGIVSDSVIYEDTHTIKNPFRYYTAIHAQSTRTHIISSGEDIIGFLQTIPHRLSDEVLTSIADYAAQNMSFVVIRPQQNPIADITVSEVSITYYAQNDIPLRLPLKTFLTDEQSFPIYINILANRRYHSTNFDDIKVNRKQIRVDSAITLNNGVPMEPPTSRVSYTHRTNYIALRGEAIAAVESQGLVTELAAPTGEIQFNASFYDDWSDQRGEFHLPIPYKTEVINLIQSYPYLTRLYGFITAKNALNLPDPEFVTTTKPSVSNVLDASDIAPLEMWGCTTRVLKDDYTVLKDYLPTGRTEGFVHPDNWEMYKNGDLRLFAPVPVDETTIAAYIEGQSTPPMLMIDSIVSAAQRSCSYQSPQSDIPEKAAYYRCMASPNMGGGWIIALLTTDEDFAENEAMYRAMVDFPLTYQYMLHPELRHSLFLKTEQPDNPEHYMPPTQIGYPDGWIEQLLGAQHLIIMPEEFTDPQNAPTVQLYPVANVGTPISNDNTQRGERKAAILAWLIEHFGAETTEFTEEYINSCGWNTPLMPFNQGMRRGYIGYVQDQHPDAQPFLIELSAPVTLYADYELDIEHIRESISIFYACG